MRQSSVWRAVIGATTVVLAACSSDQPTGSSTPPKLTASQYALHFDSLAAKLQVSSPGDIRLQWYQEIVRVMARGAAPSGITTRISGGPSFLQAVTELDLFPYELNSKLTADSTYILALWGPPLQPTGFVDMHVYFLPNSGGQPDTTRRVVTVYLDTLGHMNVDTTADAAAVVLSQGGACDLTSLTHLTVPTNPCVETEVNWTVGGGLDLLAIDPAEQVPGVRFAATP